MYLFVDMFRFWLHIEPARELFVGVLERDELFLALELLFFQRLLLERDGCWWRVFVC